MERSPIQPQPQPQQPLQQYVYADDEISLYDIWNLLVRRRLLIGATAIGFMVAAAGYSLLQKPTYAVDLVLSVGTIPSNTTGATAYIEPPASLVSQFNEVIIPAERLQQAERLGATVEEIPLVEAEVLDASAGLVRLSAITVEARVPMVEELLTRIAEGIVDEHENTLIRRTDVIRDQIMLLRAEAERLTRIGNQIPPDISAIESGDSGAEASALYSLVVGAILDDNRHRALISYDRRRSELEIALAESNPTALEQEARMGEQQGQSMTLMGSLGLVLGLMLGVFGAFGREFLANAAAQRQDRLHE